LAKDQIYFTICFPTTWITILAGFWPNGSILLQNYMEETTASAAPSDAGGGALYFVMLGVHWCPKFLRINRYPEI